jgi:hypothetical protein
VLLIGLLAGNILVIWHDDTEKVRENGDLKEQLSALRQGVQNVQQAVTGGESFCYVDLVFDRDSAMLVVINEGEVPLYDISFRMWDPADYGPQSQPSRSIEDFFEKSINTEVGNLSPKSTRILRRIALPISDSKKFEVTILARNGPFTERLRLQKVGGSWTRAVRVYSGSMNREESAVILEKIDPGFPRDQSGKVRWE